VRGLRRTSSCRTVNLKLHVFELLQVCNESLRQIECCIPNPQH